MKPNIIEYVVNQNICIGCGICASLCPENALHIEFNDDGEYIPVQDTDCLKNCNLCLKVCPFYNKGENEDALGKEIFSSIKGIKHRSETGYYINSYICYSSINHYRVNGASGGVTTWLLEKLLSQNIVDYIICVTYNDNQKKLFKFSVFSNTLSFNRSVASVYYPVEMSEVLHFIINNNGRYAITGLPCFVKGLRLAQKYNKKLRNRINFIIGLTCGQMKNKHYTTLLASISGVTGELKEVHYRGKNIKRKANDYFFTCINQKGKKGRIYFNNTIKKVWINRWFTPNACNYCDDVFAEVADISIMDAWLPDHLDDPKGVNKAITRDTTIDDLFKFGFECYELQGEKIPIDNIIQSHSSLIDFKKKQISYRLFLAKQKKAIVPQKRVNISKKINFYKKRDNEIKYKMQTMSKKLFLDCHVNKYFEKDIFLNKMKIYIKSLLFWKYLYQFIILPKYILNKIKRIIGGKHGQ